MSFSNFYEDNSFEYEDFELLNTIYKELFQALYSQVISSQNNIVIPRVETYRNYPVQRINILEGKYSIQAILERNSVIDLLDLSSYTLAERVNMWNDGTISLEDKISALKLTNSYVSLERDRGVIGELTSNIIDFYLQEDVTGQGLVRDLDYYFEDNKLYLLSDISKSSNSTDYVVAKNISIDYLLPERLVGDKIGIPYNDSITKNEYTDIVAGLLNSALTGPTLKSLKEAVKFITGFEEADVFDKYTKDLNKQVWWDSNVASPFTFVVSFPETYTQDINKLNIMIDYIKIVKPAYTNFFVILQSIYSDLYNRELRASDYHIDTIRDGSIAGRTDNPDYRTNNNWYTSPVADGQVEYYSREDNANDSYMFINITEEEYDEYNKTIIEETLPDQIDEIEDDDYDTIISEDITTNVYELFFGSYTNGSMRTNLDFVTALETPQSILVDTYNY